MILKLSPQPDLKKGKKVANSSIQFAAIDIQNKILAKASKDRFFP